MSVRLRPRFRLLVDLNADEVMEVFGRNQTNAPCSVHLFPHQVEFRMHVEERHFWSPFLNLIVERHIDGATLFGKYGPNVNVWTMFMAAYAVLGITGGFGFFLGVSQLQLDQSVSGFWIVGAALATSVVVYAVGKVGQRLAQPQMRVIHAFIEGLFDSHILELQDEHQD